MIRRRIWLGRANTGVQALVYWLIDWLIDWLNKFFSVGTKWFSAGRGRRPLPRSRGDPNQASRRQPTQDQGFRRQHQVKEDTHEKNVFFSARTTKVLVPPPQTLGGVQNHFVLTISFDRLEMVLNEDKIKFENIIFSDTYTFLNYLQPFFVDRYWPVLKIKCNLFNSLFCVSWGSRQFFLNHRKKGFLSPSG